MLTDNLIIDYINRFWIMDVDARMQLFDLKTKYQFQTSPGIDQYNMPLYNVQSETPGNPSSQDIAMFPVYQGFISPAYVNGVQVHLETQKNSFFNIWPNIVQNLTVAAVGDGGATYSFKLPILANSQTPINPPITAILRGHVDITGIISTGNNQDPIFGTTINTAIPSTSIFPAFYITTMDVNSNNVVVSDSGQFLQVLGANMPNYGLLMNPGNAPYGNTALPGTYGITVNTVNYFTGQINVTFPVNIPAGQDINVQCYYFSSGLPRSILYYNNVITLRTVPDKQYLVELDAYLSPAAFFSTSAAIPFAYMAEYIARGAARKILSDTGDTEQFMFYEPLFREQELLVWKRSQRQWQNNRTETIYSNGPYQGQVGANNIGGSSL